MIDDDEDDRGDVLVAPPHSKRSDMTPAQSANMNTTKLKAKSPESHPQTSQPRASSSSISAYITSSGQAASSSHILEPTVPASSESTGSPPVWLLDSTSLIFFGEGTREERRQTNSTSKSSGLGPMKTPLARFNETLSQKMTARLTVEAEAKRHEGSGGDGTNVGGTGPGAKSNAQIEAVQSTPNMESRTNAGAGEIQADGVWAKDLDIEDAALEYLKRYVPSQNLYLLLLFRFNISSYFLRYILAFDKDRLALSGAYTRAATFSCQVIMVHPVTPSRAPFNIDHQTLAQGRREIVSKLSTLSLGSRPELGLVPKPSRLTFYSAEKPLDLQYDVVRLEDERVLLRHGR